jgi:nitrogen fixation NifU-like protein
MDNTYNEKVMDYFENPRNVGSIENPSGVGNVGNPQCGDIMRLYIKVEDNVIVDAKFKTFGCAAAIASSSILTEIVIGKTIEEAEKLTNKVVINELGELPPKKRHCSVLAEEALESAIKDYRSKLES